VKITQVFNGYIDATFLGVVVEFKLGQKVFSAYVDLLRDEDKLNSPTEVFDDESTLPVQVPPAYLTQILKAALKYKKSYTNS